MDTRPVERHAPVLACGIDIGRVDVFRIPPRDRRDHVLPRAKYARHHRRVAEDGRVHDAIRIERQDRVDIARGPNADRITSDQLSDVFSVLVFAVYPATDQLKVGMIENTFNRSPPNTARRPLHDAKTQYRPFLRFKMGTVATIAETHRNEQCGAAPCKDDEGSTRTRGKPERKRFADIWVGEEPRIAANA